jgi:hypothetical protein
VARIFARSGSERSRSAAEGTTTRPHKRSEVGDRRVEERSGGRVLPYPLCWAKYSFAPDTWGIELHVGLGGMGPDGGDSERSGDVGSGTSMGGVSHIRRAAKMAHRSSASRNQPPSTGFLLASRPLPALQLKAATKRRF